MHILGKTWRDGYLDYHRGPGEVRIRVRAWWAVERLGDVFLPQPRSLRRLWNYFLLYGFREVMLKVKSRLGEALRDRRFFCVGMGEVLESDAAATCKPGTMAIFIAPNHPECVERVCVPGAFAATLTDLTLERIAADGCVALYSAPPPGDHPDWDRLAGWSPFSGRDVSGEMRSVLDWARDALAQLNPAEARRLPLPAPTPVAERCEPRGTGRPEKTAVLFGLGNYAKTIVLPKIDSRIEVRCIHEIEPTQIGLRQDDNRGYDTNPEYRADERYDVAFVAGYHHTHADLAIHALRQGARVLVEKPLIASRPEWERLRAATLEHPERLFVGFHLRYSPLVALARRDLMVHPGEAVHYHCIVFEIPLVRRHWYNWPTSRSRIVCNGCHWLDHFLFLNDWSAPRRWQLMKAGNGDILTGVELENGASFSMTLTDHGSARLGMSDHIELRANGVTVRIDQGRRYEAEDGSRIIRRTRAHRLAAHHEMYRQISRKMIAGEPGDSQLSLDRSCELMLNLDEQLAAGRTS